MPFYGSASKERLNECHVDIQTIFDHVIDEVDNAILEGHRGEELQNKYFRNGKSYLKFPMSKHNKIPSMAVDAVPYPVDWEDIERFKAFGNYVLGVADTLYKQGKITHRLTWGGNWKNFKDYPHFQLEG